MYNENRLISRLLRERELKNLLENKEIAVRLYFKLNNNKNSNFSHFELENEENRKKLIIIS